MSDTKDRSLDDDQAQARLPQLMRIDEVAEHLGVSVRHVRRLVQERRILFLKWGHFVMFDKGEIARWLEQFRYPAEVTSVGCSPGGAKLCRPELARAVKAGRRPPVGDSLDGPGGTATHTEE